MHRVWQAWVCMVHLIVKVVPFDYFGSRVPQAKIGKGLFCFPYPTLPVWPAFREVTCHSVFIVWGCPRRSRLHLRRGWPVRGTSAQVGAYQSTSCRHRLLTVIAASWKRISPVGGAFWEKGFVTIQMFRIQDTGWIAVDLNRFKRCLPNLKIFEGIVNMNFLFLKGWIWVTFFVWNKFWCYFVEAGLFLVSSPVFNAERSTRTGRVSPQVLWRPHVAWACQAGPHFFCVWEQKIQVPLLETKISPTNGWIGILCSYWGGLFSGGKMLDSGRAPSSGQTTFWRYYNRAWQVMLLLVLTGWLGVDSYCWWFRNPKQPPGMYETL